MTAGFAMRNPFGPALRLIPREAVPSPIGTKPQADLSDIAVFWNSGEANRRLALEMADANRNAADPGLFEDGTPMPGECE